MFFMIWNSVSSNSMREFIALDNYFQPLGSLLVHGKFECNNLATILPISTQLQGRKSNKLLICNFVTDH